MPELYRYHCGLMCRSRYWPWVGLISIIVLFAAVIVIKWGDKVCFHLCVIKFEIEIRKVFCWEIFFVYFNPVWWQIIFCHFVSISLKSTKNVAGLSGKADCSWPFTGPAVSSAASEPFKISMHLRLCESSYHEIISLYLYSCLLLIFCKFDLCFYLQAGDFELMEDGNGTMMDYQVCIFFICYPADCHKVKDGECWKLWKLGFVWWTACWKSPQCQGRCRLGLVSFSSKTWKEGSECTADWLRSNPISALCTGCDFEDGEIIFYFSFRTAALWEAASKTTHLMAVIAGSRL